MPRYIGITIGPIIDTLSLAKDTGQLWGTSYVFSYLMKKIIKDIKYDSIFGERNFIVPYTDDEELFTKPNNAGLFYDRCIFEAKEGDFERVNKIIDSNLNDLAKRIVDTLNKKVQARYSLKEVKEYVKEYFQIYYVEQEFDSDKEINTIIKDIDELLNQVELKKSFVRKEKVNFILEFLKNENIKDSFLIEDCFEEKYLEKYFLSSTLQKFKSVTHIAVAGLEIDGLDDENLEIEIFEKLKANGSKKCYLYFATVQVDGDNMGNFIKKLKRTNQFKDFSKRLLEYSKNVVDIVNDKSRGMLIFSGGDDSLFFTPVIYKDKDTIKTVFDTVDEVSRKFNEILCKEYQFEDSDEKLSISFGVSIVYHKYPLYEALEEARNLLYNKAKSSEAYINGKKQRKNAVAFNVLKHSGNTFGAVLNQSGNAYKMFKDLLKYVAANKNSQDYIRAVEQKLLRDHFIIEKILRDKNKLKNYFLNNFNEDIHKEKNIQDYLDKVCKFIEYAYEEMGEIYIHKRSENINKTSEFIRYIHSCLKLISFLNEKVGDNE